MESIKKINVLSAGLRNKASALLVFSLFTAISTGMAINAKAQTFAEWFSQKKTQKKYLLQQIAALQVYSSYLKQGYGIATNGLGYISGFLKSENGLHHTYYARLNTADPLVKNNTMVKDIMACQADILKRTQEVGRVSGMTAPEKNYLSSVSRALLKDCDQQLNTLQNVISDNRVAMSDAERMALIMKIHSDMLANYNFASRFADQVKIVAQSRQQEQNQVTVSKQLYGIN